MSEPQCRKSSVTSQDASHKQKQNMQTEEKIEMKL